MSENDPSPLTVADAVHRASTPEEHEPLRVLLAGSWHIEEEGIADGYGAVAHARWFHQKLDLIRASPWAPSREEPMEAVQEFHVGLTVDEMTRLLHSCDVVLAPDHRDSGRGLLVAEAMAAGLACVATAIPAFRAFADPNDYALFAPEDNAVELGERLIELLSDFDLRERLRERARAVAEQWRVTERRRPAG